MKRTKVHKSDEYIKYKPKFKKLYLEKYKWPEAFDEAKTLNEFAKAIERVRVQAWNEFKSRVGGEFNEYLMSKWRNRLSDKQEALGGKGWQKRYKVGKKRITPGIADKITKLKAKQSGVGKKRITPGIADKITKLKAKQSKSHNCMKYIIREARESFKGRGLEEKEKLRKLWAASVKEAFRSVKDSRAAGRTKCHFGRNKN